MDGGAPTSRATPGRPHAIYLLAVAAVLLLALAQALAVARAEWFSRDDFALLLYVQRPWSWLHAFLPLEGSFWWAWRPLGMDSFFRLAYLAFGLNAVGYFAVALAVHFALAPATWGLARRLGYAPPAAAAAGALAVLLPPALTGLYYASVFHYLAANLLGVLALVCFCEGQRRAARGPAILSGLFFGGALLCNESALVLPVVAALGSLRLGPHVAGRSRLGRALRGAAPLFALAAAYLVLRFAVLELADPPAAYRPRFGPNLLRHFWMQPSWLAGGKARLSVALLAMGAVLGAAARGASRDPQPLRRLLRAYALLVPWTLLAISVFAVLPFSHARFAMTLQVPGALLLAAHLDALWRLYGARRAVALRAGFVLLLLLVLPLHAMRQRAAHSWGGGARAFVEGVARAHPMPPPGSPLVVLYGGETLATRSQMESVRRSTHGGIALRAVRFRHLGTVEFRDVNAAAPETPCPRCLYVTLEPDLTIHRAAPPPRRP